jgi:hypothetical protein
MSSAGFTLSAAHEWIAHDPFGNVKPADRTAAAAGVTDPSGVVRLRAARGGYASFRLLVAGTGEYRLKASAGGGLEVDLYRVWYHRMAPGPSGSEGAPRYCPDALIYLRGRGGAGRIPDPDNAIEGQTVQEYWVDVFVPPDAAPGGARGRIRLTAAGRGVELPLGVEVLEAGLPEEPCLTVYHKCYGARWLQSKYPGAFARAGSGRRMWRKTIELLHHHYRLAREHRGIFRSRGGGHDGSFGPIYSPRPTGNARERRLEDWDLYDAHYGPLFDGSVFEKAAPGSPAPRRAARPVWGVYAPVSPHWPASYLWWGQPGYEEALVRCLRQFDGHLRERGWTRTQVELFFFHKKRFRWFEWDGDEPKYGKDDGFFLLMGQLMKKAVGESPVKWLLRADVSWRMKRQFESLAGVCSFWVVNRFFRWYPREIRRVVDRGDIVWRYGGTPPVDAPSSSLLEEVYRSWACGLHGYNHWLATDPGRDPWFACEGARTGMIYPGERFGIPGPIPSTRLKIQRNAIQDLDLLDARARESGRLDQLRAELAAAIPIELWGSPPKTAEELPPEDWDSRNLGTEHEPITEAGKGLDPFWWSQLRERAVPAGAS